MSMFNEQAKFTFGEFVWWIGKVVKVDGDSKKLGRVTVRIFGYHNDDIKDNDLPLAYIVQSPTSAALGGVGITPVGLLKDSIVIGFFADGDMAQIPLITGSIGGIPDKDGKTTGEADTNRLARKEKLDGTYIPDKESNAQKFANLMAEHSNVSTEPPHDYNANYPYNQVIATDNGLVIEIDDTKGSERVHVWHPSGSYIEMQSNGKIVLKSEQSNHFVSYQDTGLCVGGNLNVNVAGDANVLISGNSNIEVLGNENKYIHGSMTTKVDGNYTLEIGGSQTSKTGGTEKREASEIYLN